MEDPHSALAILEPEVVRSPGAADSWNVLGRAYFMLGMDEAAIEAYGQAVTLDEDNAYAWNNLGLVYLTLGRYADALRPLTKAAALAPELPYAQNNLGLAFEKVGRLGDAREAFARAAAAGHGPATESLARVTALLEAETPALAATDSTGLSDR
jgi:Flp pilus assembly protein TadD